MRYPQVDGLADFCERIGLPKTEEEDEAGWNCDQLLALNTRRLCPMADDHASPSAARRSPSSYPGTRSAQSNISRQGAAGHLMTINGQASEVAKAASAEMHHGAGLAGRDQIPRGYTCRRPHVRGDAWHLKKVPKKRDMTGVITEAIQHYRRVWMTTALEDLARQAEESGLDEEDQERAHQLQQALGILPPGGFEP